MKHKQLKKPWLVITATACGLFAAAAMATTAKQTKLDKVLSNVSQDGYIAAHEASLARVAIFDGQTEQAQKLLNNAKQSLAKAETHTPEVTVTINTVEKMDKKTINSSKTVETSDYIPIDAYLNVAEDFIPTPAKADKIKRANERLKRGEHAKALEDLKDAGVDVSVTRILLPVKSTLTDVDKALQLLHQHKYYEANLALKGATDGMVTDTVLLYSPGPAKTPEVQAKK